jgi:GTP-binding protein
MNTVALVGRPNVGKSTLFNRLVKGKDAIVEDTPGVTRDRLYGKSDWNGKYFDLIDTGGFIPGTEDTMERAIREQAMLAIDEADVIIFVTDGRDGVTAFDHDISRILRNSGKPIVLAVNKCDNHIQDNASYEFWNLGLDEPFPISSMNGHNTGDLLDAVAIHLHALGEEEEDDRLKIAFLGRPNAGKSSMTNALLGEDRMIVTDIPGTTRDSIDSVVKYYGEEIVLIDTAGLRRRSHVKENIEVFSIIRTARAIDRCDVGVILVDATRGIEDKDKKIINQVNDARKGLLIAINKWDLKEDKTHKSVDELTKKYREDMRTFDYVPLVFVSALTKQRATKILSMSKKIKENRQRRISTSKLNDVMMPIMQRTPPPAEGGRDLRINFITQTGIEPPVFAFFCNHPTLLKDSYKRFLERKIRENFDFEGTPISFIFRSKHKDD